MLAASDPKKRATPFARLAKKILVPCYRRKGAIHYAKKMDRAVLDWDNRDRSSYAEILGITEREKPLPKKHGSDSSSRRLETENTAFQPAMTRCSLSRRRLASVSLQKKSVSPTLSKGIPQRGRGARLELHRTGVLSLNSFKVSFPLVQVRAKRKALYHFIVTCVDHGAICLQRNAHQPWNCR